MNKFNWSEEELLAYEQMKKLITDEMAAFAQKFDEGLRVGQEKSRQEEKKSKLQKTHSRPVSLLMLSLKSLAFL